MKARPWLLLGLCLLLSAGCASKAAEEFAKLEVGMSPAEVRQALGEPEKVKKVRFKNHEEDYVVWEYSMIPETHILCPSEGVSRAVTGIATLGLSELAWNQALTKPHWIYFFDDRMVYFSRGFDCEQSPECQITAERR